MRLLLPLFSLCLYVYGAQAAGMNYFIEANVASDCKGHFPDGLSYFFEQIGGYGEKSMVVQVEKLLDIDLSDFQNYDHPEFTGSDSMYWQDIDPFETIIDSFLHKIAASPDYHQKVIYNPDTTHWTTSSAATPAELLQSLKEKQQKNLLYDYPMDRGFLSSGEIIIALQSLKALLGCYRAQGATAIKLTYM